MCSCYQYSIIVHCEMSVANGKRITFKRTRPNPLFHEWLEELYEEAKEKGSKLEAMLKVALDSITKYPLPLESGAECAVLNGFDKRLCLFLDKRLEVFKNQSAVQTCSVSSTSSEENDVESNRLTTGNDIDPYNGEENNVETDRLDDENYVDSNKPNEDDVKSYKSTDPENTPSTSSVDTNVPKTGRIRNSNKRKYMPAVRSGSYALLMALADIGKSNAVTKYELTEAAQKYSDSDIISEWKNMTQLIKKGLVTKKIIVRNNNTKIIQFSLTDEGFSLVAEHRLAQKKKALDSNDLLYDGNDCISKVTAANTGTHITNGVLNDKSTQNSQVKGINIINDANTNIEATNGIAQVGDTRTALLDNINSDVIQNHVDDSSYIELEPDSFDIILLIDKNETSGVTKKNDPTVSLFNKYPELKHEYRSLKVGDFTWVARSKRNNNQELVLPYVVERKRMDDFGSSIKDGRFHEQKFRLRKCGLNHVIYLVENHDSNKHVGMPIQSLMQALANTSVQDGFKVHVTESLTHSVRFLVTMTLRLLYEYKNKTLKGHSGEPKAEILMTFNYFNKSSVKSRPLSVTDMFIKLLLQLKGVSVEKALTITNMYKTPRSLIEKYQNCDQKEGEMLLANLKYGELNRSVGPGVSKSIYQLFTFRNVK